MANKEKDYLSLLHQDNIECMAVEFTNNSMLAKKCFSPHLLKIKNQQGATLISLVNKQLGNGIQLTEDASFPVYILEVEFLDCGCRFVESILYPDLDSLTKDVDLSTKKEAFSFFESNVRHLLLIK